MAYFLLDMFQNKNRRFRQRATIITNPQNYEVRDKYRFDQW